MTKSAIISLGWFRNHRISWIFASIIIHHLGNDEYPFVLALPLQEGEISSQPMQKILSVQVSDEEKINFPIR